MKIIRDLLLSTNEEPNIRLFYNEFRDNAPTETSSNHPQDDDQAIPAYRHEDLHLRLATRETNENNTHTAIHSLTQAHHTQHGKSDLSHQSKRHTEDSDLTKGETCIFPTTRT